MHFFFLVSFCWMLIEGFTLYYKVVKVFDTDFKMWPFYGFTWGEFKSNLQSFNYSLDCEKALLGFKRACLQAKLR